ncbi:hypothetical protein E2C01_022209 [Portunus trituberculatus]|uniref:Uncharacterized protein n=1 Tax=Portunus trituberculatus TaxID=210409 RepID=A0A5B7E725_PORTR|nr:hypothetical protein [Portunus trituberculatus]
MPFDRIQIQNFETLAIRHVTKTPLISSSVVPSTGGEETDSEAPSQAEQRDFTITENWVIAASPEVEF